MLARTVEPLCTGGVGACLASFAQFSAMNAHFRNLPGRNPASGRIGPHLLRIVAVASWISLVIGIFKLAHAPSIAATHPVTLSGDNVNNPAPGTFRHAVEVLARAGDTVQFTTPLAITLEASVFVASSKPGLIIAGPGQIGFKRKPEIGEA